MFIGVGGGGGGWGGGAKYICMGEPKQTFHWFRKITETNAKQILFRLFSVSFLGHPNIHVANTFIILHPRNAPRMLMNIRIMKRGKAKTSAMYMRRLNFSEKYHDVQFLKGYRHTKKKILTKIPNHPIIVYTD